jgi:hypothetical protein
MNQRFIGTYHLHLQGLKSAEQGTSVLAATFCADVVYSETKYFLYLALIFVFWSEEKEGFSETSVFIYQNTHRLIPEEQNRNTAP